MIVGPRCLLTCMDTGKAIPSLPYPMYTAAMRDLVITATGFEKEAKARLQKKIESMAGVYANAFHDGVTHLVAEVNKSRNLSSKI